MNIVEAVGRLNKNRNAIVKNGGNYGIVSRHCGNGITIFVYPALDHSALVGGDLYKSGKICALGKKECLIDLFTDCVIDLGKTGNVKAQVKVNVDLVDVDKICDNKDLTCVIGELFNKLPYDVVNYNVNTELGAEHTVALVEAAYEVIVMETIGDCIVRLFNNGHSVRLNLVEYVLVLLNLVDKVASCEVRDFYLLTCVLVERIKVSAVGNLVKTGDSDLLRILLEECVVLAVYDLIDIVLKLLENSDKIIKGELGKSLVVAVEIVYVCCEQLHKLILKLVADPIGLYCLEKNIGNDLGHSDVNGKLAVNEGCVYVIADKGCGASDEILTGLERNADVELNVSILSINTYGPIKIHLVISHLRELVDGRKIGYDSLDTAHLKVAVKDNVSVNLNSLEREHEI